MGKPYGQNHDIPGTFDHALKQRQAREAESFSQAERARRMAQPARPFPSSSSSPGFFGQSAASGGLPASPATYRTDNAGRVVPVAPPPLILKLALFGFAAVLLLAVFGQVPWKAVEYATGGLFGLIAILLVLRNIVQIVKIGMLCVFAYFVYRWGVAH